MTYPRLTFLAPPPGDTPGRRGPRGDPAAAPVGPARPHPIRVFQPVQALAGFALAAATAALAVRLPRLTVAGAPPSINLELTP